MAPSATIIDKGSESNKNVGALGMTTSGKKLKIREYPKFASLEEELRDPILTDHFWLNPLSQHFATISVSDLILVNEDGQVVIGDEPINAAAFAIHSEIHKARPDVHAACHAHSVAGKAYSVFGKPLDMMTQDALRFYKSHAVYDNFGGVVLDREEGKRIAKALGNGKAVILQNHGLLTVGQSVDEAAFWFISLDKTCMAQLLADAASAGSGHKKILISDEEAEYSYEQVGIPAKGWLAFQPYYDEILKRTSGDFLK
ncbi:hypothetical protein DTO027B5_2947 [Paecilomyces variotii]|nr:hypothetical protein DTO027B3_6080 [Paecilomyces variotii]KAJ9335251.1 hypothetical protein DTO027B5_2947 [Paecilomyces variotii]